MMKFLPWALIVVLSACLILSIQTCNQKSNTVYSISSLNKKLLEDTCKYYTALNGEIVSTNKALTVTAATLKSVNDDLTAQLKNMKIASGKVVYIDREVPHIVIHDSIHHDTIKNNKPVVFADSSNRWYHIRGIAGLNYTKLTAINIYDTCYTIQLRDGKVDIAHKNPYIISTNLLSVDVARPTPFFRKFWVDVGIGAIGALLGEHYLLPHR